MNCSLLKKCGVTNFLAHTKNILFICLVPGSLIYMYVYIIYNLKVYELSWGQNYTELKVAPCLILLQTGTWYVNTGLHLYE